MKRQTDPYTKAMKEKGSVCRFIFFKISWREAWNLLRRKWILKSEGWNLGHETHLAKGAETMFDACEPAEPPRVVAAHTISHKTAKLFVALRKAPRYSMNMTARENLKRLSNRKIYWGT